MISIRPLETLVRDARYAWRVLRRTPVFTLTAVLTLALAIGVNTAVFSIVDAVLFKPLPYPQPENLSLVQRTVNDAGRSSSGTAVDGQTWELVRDQAHSVTRAVFSSWTTGVNLVVSGSEGRASQARFVQQQRVGAGFFGVLGVQPQLGREFNAEEDRDGGPIATMLSARLWRDLFSGDPAALGQSIVLRGEPHTIVGVMPAGFHSGVDTDLWTPLRPSTTGAGGGENYQIVMRLAADSSWVQAETEIAAIGAEIARRTPSTSGLMLSFGIVPLQRGWTQDTRQPLLMLWGAVAVVLIVACVNLAGLLLARASGRRREIATRIALGSGRAAVVRQLFVESVVLAAIGGAAGILLGSACLELLKWLARDAFEIWQPVSLDGRALAAAGGMSLVASAAFGLAPALQASRLNLQSGLLAGARTVAGPSARWSRRAIVVAEVALGVVLLVAAGLLVRTFVHLNTLDPGFDPDGVVTAAVSLEDARYRTGEQVESLFNATLERLDTLPGIEAAAVSLGLPYERLLNLGFQYADGPEAASPEGQMTSATYVSPGFFEALRLPLRRGRVLDDRDRAGAPPVVVVNEAFARTYFDDNPLGRRIRLSGTEREIVGVVGDVQVRPGWGDRGPLAAMPLAYLSVGQVNDGFLRLVHGWFSPTFVVRSTLPPERTALTMRQALDRVDPLLPFAEVRPMSNVRMASLAQQRLMMALLAALAATAVLLVAVGIHGLIASSVLERTREMGIRLAVGATNGQAMRTLALPGIAMAGAGTILGLGGAVALARVLGRFVWGVSATDPVTFVAVAAMLMVVATIASLTPTARILRLDPASTLRHE